MNFAAIELALGAPGVLALGGWLKSSACGVSGTTAFVSGSLGDLTDAGACGQLEQTAVRLCSECGVDPLIVAHDLHPDFFSSRLAIQISGQRGIPSLGVQHHHAHVAAVCAEHRVIGPVLALGMDGVGLGTDGQAWGGELLHVDGADFQRLGRLLPLHLPGGDIAARESWRMGASALFSLGRSEEIARRFSDFPAAQTVQHMLERNFNCPTTSSLGRLFDAAAGLLGVCPVQSFEGEAATELESLSRRYGPVTAPEGCYSLGEKFDFRPLLSILADERNDGRGAALFHAALVAGLAEWVGQAVERNGVRRVALGGGCFLNRQLSERLSRRLQDRRIEVLTARRFSPGDSALSLGQAWVAVHHLRNER